MLPHYNEKVMARLGASLSKRGHLSREGQKIAMKAIRRYHAILKGLKVKNVRAVATAAVRRASDGSEFVAQIEEETGLRVDIIDGAEEARLSALGVSGSVFQAEGVVDHLQRFRGEEREKRAVYRTECIHVYTKSSNGFGNSEVADGQVGFTCSEQ